MDYYDQDNGASGSIPEFGAIFMSNTETYRECFQRKIFALPSSKAEFVKHIKAGMVLFLFEFKKRQLFGVYQASSDGAMDIVPHAFNDSGKCFRAQVRFTQIWHCGPLSEKEFQDAIRENYFSSKKFNFGLSQNQVRRLLYLFSSRKLKNKMPPRPLSETVVELAGMKRRLMEDDRFELKERRYMEAAEYGEINPAAVFDHHANSFTRANEKKVIEDDGFNTEGELHPYSKEDFLAKRRRLGNNYKLMTNGVADAICNGGTIRTFRSDSPEDSLDEGRRLADGCRSLPVERIDENELDRIHNHLEYLVDPLDAIANAEYRFMQRSRLTDKYNMHNDSGQAFKSDTYEESLDNYKHAIDDSKFLVEDSVQRGYNPQDSLKPVAYGDSSLKLFKQAREVIDDQDSLMYQKLENRYNLECVGSPIRVFEDSASPLHKIRETSAGGRLLINGSEPHFGTSSVGGFSFENISCPFQYGHRIIYDRKYPVVEERSNENDMVDNNFCPPSLGKSDGFVTGVGRRMVDDLRFRMIERTENEEDSHMPTNPAASMEYHSVSQPKQNFSSFSQKLLSEKGLPQFTVSRNFDPSRSTFDDATITTAVPYSPDRPSFSHGYSDSIPPNQNSNLVQKNHPDHASLGNLYSPSKNRLPQYFFESDKSRPLDVAPEYGRKCFPTSTSRHQSLHHESTTFANSSLPVHVDLNTSAPLNYRGSLFAKRSPQHINLENIEGEQRFTYRSNSRENPVLIDLNTSTPVDYGGSLSSKLSPRCTDPGNIGGKQGSFAYPSKSRDNPFAFDRNLSTAPLDMNKHVPRLEMDMFPGQDNSFSESKDAGLHIRHPERDLARLDENQYFRSSSNMNLKEPHKVSEAPNASSYVKRRSVFSRLTTSREESKCGKERNDTDLSYDDRYMDASADEVMDMLQQGGNQPQRKLRNRVGELPTHEENTVSEKKRESAVDGKKTQSHIEANHSTMEKNKLNDASLDTADSMDEAPTETRVMDFKRRSEGKRIMVGITAGSDTCNTITGGNEEVKSYTKTTLKRRKLVRPVFSKPGSATDAICSNETSKNPPTILDKEVEVSNNNTNLSNVLASQIHKPMESNNNKHRNPDKKKDAVAHVLPSTPVEVKGHETTNVDLQLGSSQVLKETTQQKCPGMQISASAEGILAKDVDSTITALELGAGCGNNLIEVKKRKKIKRKKKITMTQKTDMVSSL